MTEQQPDRMGKVQADLVHLSRLLNSLAGDVYELARELPQRAPSDVPTPQPVQPSPQGMPYAPGQYPPPTGVPLTAMRPQGQPPVVKAPYPSAPVPPIPSSPPQAAAPAGRAQSPRPSVPAPPSAPPVAPEARPVAAAPPWVPMGPPPVQPRPVAGPPRRKVSIAEIFSIVGSAITLLGVAFVLLLPADGFLGQIPRAGIGIGLAIVVVIVALVQHAKEPSNIGSQALLATGVASAFLSILALSSIFTNDVGQPLLPPLIGITLGGVVSLGGVAVARWWRSQWLAVLAVLGSLILAPYLGGQSVLTPMIFMLVMTLVTAAFQHKLDWVVLLLARVLPTVLYFIWVLIPGERGLLADPSSALLLTCVLALGGLGIAVQHQRGSQAMRAVGVSAMVFMVVPLLLAMWSADHELAGWLVIALALVFGAVGLTPNVFANDVRAACVPLGAVLLLLGVARVLDGQHLGYVFFALTAAYFGIYVANRFLPVFVVASVAGVIGLIDWLPTIAGVFIPLSDQGMERVVASLLGLMATVMAMMAIKALAARSQVWLFYLTWVVSTGFGSVAVIIAGATIGQNIGREYAGFQTAHAVVTVAWLLISVLLLRLGLRTGPFATASVRLAIVFASAAVAKLFLFDLSTLPDLVRALAFLAVGLLMLGIGTWYHKQLEKARRPAPEGGPAQAPPPPVAPDPAISWPAASNEGSGPGSMPVSGPQGPPPPPMA